MIAAGNKLTAPVVADSRLFVADVDSHRVIAFSAEDGKQLWSYTAGGPVDSPPTIMGGLCIFGCSDGKVYCLRASDGELAWRFDAAPFETRLMDDEQLESVWPVPGSVLVQDGKCWFAAGRSSYLDGGIHVCCLDPVTGEVQERETIYDPDPETGEMPGISIDADFEIPGLLNDIPGSNGKDVFIRQMNVSSAEANPAPHIYFTGGFMDEVMFNRTCWIYNKTSTAGMMIHDEKMLYGVEVYSHPGNREALFSPGQGTYRLLCCDPERTITMEGKKLFMARGQRPKTSGSEVWQQVMPVRPTAMAKTAEVLFVAGMPDVVDASDPHGAWEGRKGGLVIAVSPGDGRELSRIEIASPPVWHGIAAADAKLFISMENGEVVCLAGK